LFNNKIEEKERSNNNDTKSPGNTTDVDMDKEKVEDKFFEGHLEVHPPVKPSGRKGKGLINETGFHIHSRGDKQKNINRVKTDKSLNDKAEQAAEVHLYFG